MKIEIKSRWDASVLFEAEISDDETFKVRAALRLAVSRGASLRGANLRGADLGGASLRGAYLMGADLEGANLMGAYLRGAYLMGAYLRGAYLEGAYLMGANLMGASLRGASLRGADLMGAYLRGAYLEGANLMGAYLRGADHVIDAGQPNGWQAFGWHREGVLMVQVGCRSKSIEDGREYWAGKKNRREVMAALDYVEAVARLREWPIKESAKAA